MSSVIPQWSPASPPLWSCRLHPGRTCWKPSWVSAQSCLLRWWTAHKWTLWSRWCRHRSCQRSWRRAVQTWRRPRKGRTAVKQENRFWFNFLSLSHLGEYLITKSKTLLLVWFLIFYLQWVLTSVCWHHCLSINPLQPFVSYLIHTFLIPLSHLQLSLKTQLQWKLFL